MNANFIDWAFNKLTNTLPANKRFPSLPAGRVKRLLQNVDYAVDRVFIYLFLRVMLPVALLATLYVTCLTIKQIFQF